MHSPLQTTNVWAAFVVLASCLDLGAGLIQMFLCLPEDLVCRAPAHLSVTHKPTAIATCRMQFWREQLRAVGCLNPSLSDLKNHPLPLARIKKIMKSDEDVRMISSEAPVLFAKACELFILELTHRAWACSETNKRRTLQQTDIVHAILNHEDEVFEFLVRPCSCLLA
jgi:nuclear transcription factor Y, gamma